MALQSLVATPHPDGNRIDLSWELPSDKNYIGVRVVRRVGTYPLGPDDGAPVVTGVDFKSATDTGLHSEQVYYYMLYPYESNPPVFEINLKNRIAAMATASQDISGYMMSLLPAIYHRYDKDQQQLESFLKLVGGQFDQLYSYANAAGDLQNLENINGHLLPLLAQWIGWKTNHKLEFSAQRAELRHAPPIYKTIGIIPTVEATIKRISGWESRTKEFVHNIFTSNQPEHLNIWSLERDNSGTWSESPELLSLDFAYEGRPTSTVDSHGVRWLFYHTQRKGHWEIWFKTSPTVGISLALSGLLVNGPIATEVLVVLNDAGLSVSPDATISILSADQIWGITDTAGNYVIERINNQLVVYSLSGELTALSASLPLIVNDNFIYKNPSATQQGGSLWLFWSTFDENQKKWQIEYRIRNNAQWSDIGPARPDPMVDIDMNPFAVGVSYDPTPQRRQPYALIDGDGRLWLFWLENDGTGWQLRYNRRDGVGWGTPVTFPSAGTPRVENDLSVTIQPDLPDPRIYVFWSRPAETSTPGQIRWEVSFRVKEGLELDAADWSAVQSLPKDAVSDNHHDREPCPVLSGTNIELFWSSNRGDTGWTLWRSVLTDPTANTWSPAGRVTTGAYSQRNPLPIIVGDVTWLVYRSNQGLAYKSNVYGATETYDDRYAGSTTMDVRQLQKLGLRKSFEDIQRYTYDTGDSGDRTNDDWIARDTIGSYLNSNMLSLEAIENGIDRIKPVLNEFMPATDRAVFITNSEIHTEHIYHYNQPVNAESYFITSTYEDDFTSVLESNVLGEGEDFSGTLDV